MTMFKVPEVRSLAARCAVLYLSDKNDGVIGSSYICASLLLLSESKRTEPRRIDLFVCATRDLLHRHGGTKTRLDPEPGEDHRARLILGRNSLLRIMITDVSELFPNVDRGVVSDAYLPDARRLGENS